MLRRISRAPISSRNCLSISTGVGTGAVTYKLRDWLFSRQRFWGEPFPIVYDPDDGLPRYPEGKT